MRNRTIPLTVLLVVLLFAWLAHKPGAPTASNTGPTGSSNGSGDFPAPSASDRSDGRERDRSRRDREDREDREDRRRDEDGVQTRDAGDDTGHESSEGQPNGGRSRDRGASRSRPVNAAPGTFDFYLLNLSWSPEFCATHPSKSECAHHLGFILHGLWPQNTDGTYPEHCSDTPPPADLSSFGDITPDTGLLAHEWTTHGTCSGLGPDQFFALARRAFRSVVIPPSLTSLQAQSSGPPSETLAAFASANPSFPPASLALSCGNNRLTAIEICMDKSAHPISCSGIRSCRANSIRITPP